MASLSRLNRSKTCEFATGSSATAGKPPASRAAHSLRAKSETAPITLEFRPDANHVRRRPPPGPRTDHAAQGQTAAISEIYGHVRTGSRRFNPPPIRPLASPLEPYPTGLRIRPTDPFWDTRRPSPSDHQSVQRSGKSEFRRPTLWPWRRRLPRAVPRSRPR